MRAIITRQLHAAGICRRIRHFYRRIHAVNAIRQADLLIVGGSSLTVYPAAGLLRYYRGGRLVLINKTPTPQDESAGLLFRESIGRVLTEALRLAGIEDGGEG